MKGQSDLTWLYNSFTYLPFHDMLMYSKEIKDGATGAFTGFQGDSV